jgi:hypothetical protein
VELIARFKRLKAARPDAPPCEATIYEFPLEQWSRPARPAARPRSRAPARRPLSASRRSPGGAYRYDVAGSKLGLADKVSPPPRAGPRQGAPAGAGGRRRAGGERCWGGAQVHALYGLAAIYWDYFSPAAAWSPAAHAEL